MNGGRTYFDNAEADFNSHINCIKGVLFTGIAALCFGYTGVYCLQKIVAAHANIAYPTKLNILVSALAAVFICRQITSYAISECDNKFKFMTENREKEKSNIKAKRGLGKWIEIFADK